MTEVLGQIVDFDRWPRREYQEPLDGIGQLPDVPGPPVPLEDPHRVRRQRLLTQPAPLVQRQEVRRQTWDVLRPLAQRRQDDAEDVETVQEVLAEPTGAHQLVDIAVGGHDDADVYRDRSHPAHPAQLAVIEHLEELRLHLRRHLSELVEKQRSALCELEEPRLLGHRTGERASLVPKELVLEEVVRHRRTVHVEERLLPSPALLVYSARQDSLAGARLPQDHDLGVAGGGSLGKLQNGPDCRARADEIRAACRAQHASERGVFAPQSAMLHRPPEGLLDQRRLHRLSQVVEGAQLHGCHTVVIVWLPREDHHLARETRLSETPEHFEAAEPWHPEVEQHDVEGLLRDALQRCLAAGDGLHEMAGALEAVPNEEAKRFLVVDDEDAHRLIVACEPRLPAHDSAGSSNSTVVP